MTVGKCDKETKMRITKTRKYEREKGKGEAKSYFRVFVWHFLRLGRVEENQK